MKTFVKNLFHAFLFFGSLYCQAHMQYIYPVAQLDEDNLLVMHQKSFDDLELWIWNRHEKSAIKELSSLFLPSNVQVLPSKNGYSFIDRGRIRIKFFNKRAPRALDIYDPIHAIVSMKWINDEQFYFVGKHEDRYNLFLCDTSDRNIRIFCLNNFNDDVDFLYPSKVEDFIFCITRDTKDLYTITRLAWSSKPFQDELICKMHKRRNFNQNEEDFIQFNSDKIQQDLLLQNAKPLCFLSMKQKDLGFVLEVEALHDEHSSILMFSCCSLEQSIDGWSLKRLFQFQLPKQLLVGTQSQRLYESIHPFLPVYAEEWIYFTTYNQSCDQCCVQRYHISTGLTEPINNIQRSAASGQHYFAPFVIDQTCYCGISCKSELKSPTLLNINPVTGVSYCFIPQAEL